MRQFLIALALIAGTAGLGGGAAQAFPAVTVADSPAAQVQTVADHGRFWHGRDWRRQRHHAWRRHESYRRHGGFGHRYFAGPRY